MNYRDKLDFIARVAPWAQMSQSKYGVPASIVIAQAILESNWGQSLLAAQANNFFGIKDSRIANDGYVEFKTTEILKGIPRRILARFEKFNDAQRSFDCHGRLLGTLPRYQKAMADSDDPFVFAARLYECGYSTDPAYPQKLASLITEFRLGEYDAPKGAKEQRT